MEVQQGSGTYVASKENAQIFIEKYKNVQSVQEIRQDLLESVQRQKEELDEFSDLLNVLVSQTKKKFMIFQHLSPMNLRLPEKRSIWKKAFLICIFGKKQVRPLLVFKQM